jgi:hypothetical protein
MRLIRHSRGPRRYSQKDVAIGDAMTSFGGGLRAHRENNALVTAPRFSISSLVSTDDQWTYELELDVDEARRLMDRLWDFIQEYGKEKP